MRHGFLTRIGGVSKGCFSSLNFDIRDGDDIGNVEQNKAIAGRVFCFKPIGLLTANQVHGNHMLTIENPVKDLSALSKTDADAIIKKFGSDRKIIIAAIGPSIGPCCYKVGDVVVKEFGGRSSEFRGNEFIVKEGNAWRLDLKKANYAQLLKSGILKPNMSVQAICPSCRNDLFFSYRKD